MRVGDIMPAMPPTSPMLTAALGAARRAAGLIRRRSQNSRAGARHKSGGELVTATDPEAEEIIRETLAETFPEHGFLGEESGMRGDADACWVVDPLDGTTNFVHGYGSCAVSIAFCRGGAPVVAVICDVFADAFYSAEEGQGAFCDERRIRVSARASFPESLVIAGGQMDSGGYNLWPLVTRIAPQLRGVRRTGSTALDMAYVAAGKADALISGPVRFWDVAAGWLLLREAGGLIADIHGKPEFAFAEAPPPFAAAGAKMFPRFLAELQTCKSEKP